MKKYCVIGKSLPYTLSPQIHREFGLDYSAVELCDENALSTFINNLEFDGFNITIPYKQTIIKYLDKVEQTAKEIGAFNTVVNFHGKLYGYNTDLEGLRYALRQAQIELRDKAVMILGSGGASKTAQYLAKKEGAKSVTVVSRSGEANYENCYEKQDTEVIINTTPVGMMPKESAIPLDISKFENLESVYDLIYNPLRTRLIIEAKDRELRASNGLNMLVEQARLARDLFTEESTTQKLTEQVVKKLEIKFCNIVLTGMAGSGKSEIGKELAKISGRQLVDTDSIIAERTKMSIPEIFEKYGEKYFRELESEVIAEVSKKQGVVIATGGGATMLEKNRIAFSANGKIVLIVRELKELATVGRPLSCDYEKVEKLWSQRKSVYENFADITIKNSKSVKTAAKEIIKKLSK